MRLSKTPNQEIEEAYEKILNAQQSKEEANEESKKEVIEEAAQPISFHEKCYVFFDRSMGADFAEWIDSAEDLQDALAAAKRVKAPKGVHIWEDTEGNIIVKVK